MEREKVVFYEMNVLTDENATTGHNLLDHVLGYLWPYKKVDYTVDDISSITGENAHRGSSRAQRTSGYHEEISW